MISGQINTTPVLISKDYNKIECTLACPSKPMRNHTLTKSNSLLRLPPLIPVEMSQLALTWTTHVGLLILIPPMNTGFLSSLSTKSCIWVTPIQPLFLLPTRVLTLCSCNLSSLSFLRLSLTWAQIILIINRGPPTLSIHTCTGLLINLNTLPLLCTLSQPSAQGATVLITQWLLLWEAIVGRAWETRCWNKPGLAHSTTSIIVGLRGCLLMHRLSHFSLLKDLLTLTSYPS